MITSVIVKNKIESDYMTSRMCKAGDKLPTIRNLANEYGVSYVTVLDAIKMLAKDGKVVTRQGSGVYVSGSVTNTKHPVTKKIGFITNYFTQQEAFGYKILEGMERLTSCRGYRLEIANSNGSIEKEKKALAEFIKGGVEGVVLYPVSDRGSGSEYLANTFTEIPIVVVDLALPEMQRPSVTFDNYNAGYEMAKYLIKKHKKQILFFHNRPLINRSVRDRISGCKQAVEDMKLSYIGTTNDFDFSVKLCDKEDLKCLHNNFEIIFNSNNRPDAIIASSDFMAANLYLWLTSNGYKVPSEVELVGFDNIIPESVPWFNSKQDYLYHWPTTNPDFARLGEKATELLLEMIQANNKIVKEIVLPCPILVQRHRMVHMPLQEII